MGGAGRARRRGSVAILGSILLALPLAHASATTASLQNEFLNTPDDPIFDTSAGPDNPPNCDPAGVSTVTYAGKGPVTGPFPGTMSFSGSFTIGPQHWTIDPLTGPATSDPGYGFSADYGEVQSFTGAFSIVENGTTTVTGTLELTTPLAGGVNAGSCYGKASGDWFGYSGLTSGALVTVFANVKYVATIDGQQITGATTFRQRQTCVLLPYQNCGRSGGMAFFHSPSLPYDPTGPVLSPTVLPNPVQQGASATADPGASDPETGITSSSCDPVDTSAAGTFSVSCSATNGGGVTASASASYQVLAPPVTVHVATTGSGAGAITSQPAGISCGVTCSASFDAGSSVELIATADIGSAFSGWSGDCTGLNPLCTLSATGSPSATASFAKVVTNHPPVANTDSATTPEDTAVLILLAGSDPDSDGLTFAVGAKPAHGSLSGTAPTVTYTPDPDFNGIDSFTFTVNDGAFSSAPAVVTITVTPVNDPPVPKVQSVTLNEDTTKNLVLKASDVDGDPLTYKITGNPLHGWLSGAPPNVVYEPFENFNGADSFSFSVSDGQVSASAVIPITVKPLNDVPHVTAWSFAAREGQQAGPFGVATFTDPDLQSSSTYTATIRWGDGTSSAGKIKYLADLLAYDVIGSHTYKHCGTFTITVTVVDSNGGTARDSVTEKCNDAPGTAYNGGTGAAPAGRKVTWILSSMVDSNPYASSSDWSATITWGDGTPATKAQIKDNYSGSGWPGDFVAVGTHTFTKPGFYTMHVMWKSDCGLSVTTTVTARIT